MKRGHSLLELMIATMISGVILLGLATSFAACGRMIRLTLREGELAVSARVLRDRLLFALAAPSGGAVTAGLLSGTSAAANVLEGGASRNVLLQVPVVRMGNGAVAAHPARLILSDAGLCDERAPVAAASRAWLAPGGFALAAGTMSDVVTPVEDASGRTHTLLLDVTLTAPVRGFDARHAERISVPLLGRRQP